MAIRIRKINNTTIALCAAETDAKEGDLYLDDDIHHALSTKFGLDWEEMGFLENPPIDIYLAELMKKEKIRDAKEEIEKWMNKIEDGLYRREKESNLFVVKSVNKVV